VDYPGYVDFRARREETVWQRMTRVVWVLLTLVAVLGGIILFLPQQRKLEESRAEVAALQAQVDEQNQLLGRHEREVHLLKNNPEYLAIIARDQLDRMKDGETIFRLEPPEAARRK
jgi:cell division protein FtsB